MIRAALLALVALTISLPTPAAAFCRMTTGRTSAGSGCSEEGEFLSWRRRCVEYAIDVRGSATLDRAEIQAVLRRSVASWSSIRCDGEPVGFELRESAEPSTCVDAQFRRTKGNINTVGFVDDWEERDYDPQAFALTTVWHDTGTGEIFDADIQINESLGPYQICPAPGGCPDGPGGTPEGVDLENVTTHELGHVFGLGHSRDSNATMFAMSPRGEVTKRILRTDDELGFCALYGDGLPSECDFEPRGGLDLNCEDDGGGGCRAAPGGHEGAASGAFVALLTLFAARQRRRWRPIQ